MWAASNYSPPLLLSARAEGMRIDLGGGALLLLLLLLSLSLSIIERQNHPFMGGDTPHCRGRSIKTSLSRSRKREKPKACCWFLSPGRSTYLLISKVVLVPTSLSRKVGQNQLLLWSSTHCSLFGKWHLRIVEEPTLQMCDLPVLRKTRNSVRRHFYRIFSSESAL